MLLVVENSGSTGPPLFTVQAFAAHTVMGLKLAISDEQAIPPETQSLRFHDEFLEDQRTLASYELISWSVIDLHTAENPLANNGVSGHYGYQLLQRNGATIPVTLVRYQREWGRAIIRAFAYPGERVGPFCSRLYAGARPDICWFPSIFVLVLRRADGRHQPVGLSDAVDSYMGSKLIVLTLPVAASDEIREALIETTREYMLHFIALLSQPVTEAQRRTDDCNLRICSGLLGIVRPPRYMMLLVDDPYSYIEDSCLSKTAQQQLFCIATLKTC